MSKKKTNKNIKCDVDTCKHNDKGYNRYCLRQK